MAARSGAVFRYALFLPRLRALIMRLWIVLADDPTGSLEAKTGQNVAGLLKMTAETFHQTLLMITHNLELARLADRVVRLRDGRIVG